MNPVVDTIMLVLFVLFMIYIFRGYHISRRQADEEKERNDSES